MRRESNSGMLGHSRSTKRSSTHSTHSEDGADKQRWNFTHAITRELPSSFASALTMQTQQHPINLGRLVPHTAHGGEAHGTLLLFQGLAMAVACLVVLGMAYAGYQRVLSGAARRHKGSKAGTNPKLVTVVESGAAPKEFPALTGALTTMHSAEHTSTDTNAGLVLDAIKANRLFGGDRYSIPATATDRFSIDSLLSVWCYVNRAQALAHEPVIRHMARIGELREAFLSPELVHAHGAADGVTSIREAYTALKLCIWMRSQEAAHFSSGGAAEDCDAKMQHFLPLLGPALEDPEALWAAWQEEYTQITSGFDSLLGPGCTVSIKEEVGLAVVRCPEPLHCCALFSHTFGADVVLCMYDSNRYALECKPTPLARLRSRPAWPRLSLAPLAHVLNALEQAGPGKSSEPAAHAGGSAGGGGGGVAGGRLHRGSRTLSSAGPLSAAAVAAARGADAAAAGVDVGVEAACSSGASGDSGGDKEQLAKGTLDGGRVRKEPDGCDAASSGRQELVWVAGALEDASPTLKLEPWSGGFGGSRAKAQQRGSPCDRLLFSSTIPPHVMLAVVSSFCQQGLKGLHPKRGGWSMPELHAISAERPMTDWAANVLSQAEAGAFDLGSTSTGLTGPALAYTPTNPSASGHGIVLVPPQPIPPDLMPDMRGEASSIATQEDIAALLAGGAVPARFMAGAPWRLLYSGGRHGYSLASLYRRAAHAAPTLLLIRDTGGAVFGAFGEEAWHVGPRFYGTGETCVFTLHPRRMLWPWLRVKKGEPSNELFQFGSCSSLGVGGAGHFAIWVDNDLYEGSSGQCATFGSPQLSSSPEFHIHAVELWQL